MQGIILSLEWFSFKNLPLIVQVINTTVTVCCHSKCILFSQIHNKNKCSPAAERLDVDMAWIYRSGAGTAT